MHASLWGVVLAIGIIAASVAGWFGVPLLYVFLGWVAFIVGLALAERFGVTE